MSSRSHPRLGRNLLRRAAIVAVAPALALAMSALPFATPAALAISCPRNTLCTWQNSNYSGTQWNLTHSIYWQYAGAGPNDKISSLYWNDAYGQFAYLAKNCPADSQWTWIDLQAKVPNLANAKWPNGTSMNDSISAYTIGPRNQMSPAFPPHGSRVSGGC